MRALNEKVLDLLSCCFGMRPYLCSPLGVGEGRERDGRVGGWGLCPRGELSSDWFVFFELFVCCFDLLIDCVCFVYFVGVCLNLCVFVELFLFLLVL